MMNNTSTARQTIKRNYQLSTSIQPIQPVSQSAFLTLYFVLLSSFPPQTRSWLTLYSRCKFLMFILFGRYYIIISSITCSFVRANTRIACVVEENRRWPNLSQLDLIEFEVQGTKNGAFMELHRFSKYFSILFVIVLYSCGFFIWKANCMP